MVTETRRIARLCCAFATAIAGFPGADRALPAGIAVEALPPANDAARQQLRTLYR